MHLEKGPTSGVRLGVGPFEIFHIYTDTYEICNMSKKVLDLECAWLLVALQVRWTCLHAKQTSHLLCSRPAMHSSSKSTWQTMDPADDESSVNIDRDEYNDKFQGIMGLSSH